MADYHDFDRGRARVITMSINIDDEVHRSMSREAFESYLRSMVARAIGEKLLNDGMAIRTGRRNELHRMTTYTFERPPQCA